MYQGTGIKACALALMLDLTPMKAILVDLRFGPAFLAATGTDQPENEQRKEEQPHPIHLKHLHLCLHAFNAY
ncbi:hypothetical protein JCM31598_19720 [Desulfonatronum parangueonense]